MPTVFADPLTDRIAAFLTEVGVEVVPRPLTEPSFLPGIRLERGRLIVDESQLLYPGDLLHEAGHLAVMTPARRAEVEESAGPDQGDEIGAIAWSWAALTHLGLDPAVVFHPAGYRGSAGAFVENFEEGRFVGVPLLQWMGLTLDEKQAAARGLPAFPHMLRWLRE